MYWSERTVEQVVLHREMENDYMMGVRSGDPVGSVV